MKLLPIIIKIPILKRLIPSIIRSFLILIKYEIFQIRFKNIVLELNIRDPQDREILFTQEYEKKQFIYLEEIIEAYNINIFLDIGANSGIYSLIFSKKFKQLNVYAIEPIKKTYNKLLRNINTNNLVDKITTFNFGLSNKRASLNVDTKIKFGYRQSAGYHVSEKGSETAEFIKGDSIIKYKNKNILIKIDTEGHEKFVLIGLENLILSNNIILQIEIWEKNFNKVDEVLNNYNLTFMKRIGNDYYYKKI